MLKIGSIKALVLLTCLFPGFSYGAPSGSPAGAVQLGPHETTDHSSTSPGSTSSDISSSANNEQTLSNTFSGEKGGGLMPFVEARVCPSLEELIRAGKGGRIKGPVLLMTRSVMKQPDGQGYTFAADYAKEHQLKNGWYEMYPDYAKAIPRLEKVCKEAWEIAWSNMFRVMASAIDGDIVVLATANYDVGCWNGLYGYVNSCSASSDGCSDAGSCSLQTNVTSLSSVKMVGLNHAEGIKECWPAVKSRYNYGSADGLGKESLIKKEKKKVRKRQAWVPIQGTSRVWPPDSVRPSDIGIHR